MNKDYNESYKSAGVDVTAGYKAVELIGAHAKKTMVPAVVSGLGGFGGLFSLGEFAGMTEPVLVSGTDGVGTKLKLAFLLDRHNTIGIDCVAMCTNDIICAGASPLFFLDYLAVGKNMPEKIASIVEGVAEGCMQSGCALIGGETAEMPGFYSENEYDLAGFAVGIVDKPKIIDKESVREGDVIIGLPSSGVHSNGFSLVRKVFNIDEKSVSRRFSGLNGTLGEELLTPTKIYVKPMLELIKKIQVKSAAHITGGGFYENIPRALPNGLTAKINTSSIKAPPIFGIIEKEGGIPRDNMYATFNMGIGMCAVVNSADADRALEILKSNGEDAVVIGEVITGSGMVL